MEISDTETIPTQDDMRTPEETIACPNPKIDKLTLEMFMNTNYYSKYLSKSDPHKYQELETFRNSLRKYKHDLLDLTCELIENPGNHSELYQKFEDFMTVCIKHIQHKQEIEERQNRRLSNGDDEVSDGLSDPEDTTFMGGEIDTASTTMSTMFPRSYWGPKIARFRK